MIVRKKNKKEKLDLSASLQKKKKKKKKTGLVVLIYLEEFLPAPATDQPQVLGSSSNCRSVSDVQSETQGRTETNGSRVST